MTRSCVSGGGARDAIVWVNERSWWRTADMKALRRSSAAAVWACMKRRACLIWPARRSVGVGDEGRESSFGAGDDFGGSSRARSS